MRVMIVSRGIPEAGNPMSGIFEWDQARALRAAGVEVTFIVLDLRSLRRLRNLRTRAYEREGINVVYGSMPLGAVPAPLLYGGGRFKLRRLLKKAIGLYGRPDVVHAHFTDIGAIAAAEARRLDIPCVVTEHSSALNLDSLAKSTIYMATRAYGAANRVVTVSNRLHDRLIQHFGVESQVVNNVVDTEAIKFAEKKSVDPSGGRLFVAIGNLLPLKGHDLLVASFAEAALNNARLIIIGDGPERANLQRQIDSLGVGNKVTLAGRKTRSEISDYLAAADCFVLASNRETFGVVYIEAMLAGVPVIATRCGGPEDFVNADNGLLIEPGNRPQLTAALKHMAANSCNYSRRKIHDFALSNFAAPVIAQKLIEIYKSVIK